MASCSAKALSKYTEMVDSLIREQMDALEAASDDARIKLREWELPECLQALDAGSAAALPDGLRAELERLEDHGGVQHLQDLQKQVQVWDHLLAISSLLCHQIASYLYCRHQHDYRLLS